MKRLILILALLPLAVFGQTKNVLKGISTNALTEPLVVPTGKSITIDSGGTITNNGTATGFGDGSVTSVALTMPSIFSVSGSPITTSGTLAASLATQAANLVFAGPTTGSAAAPSFRSLVAADIPDLSGTYQPLSATLTTLSSATAAGLALMDDADATAQRATLGLGASALLATSTGGNGAADLDKAALYTNTGQFQATGNVIVYDPANLADANKAAYYGNNFIGLPNGGGLYVSILPAGNSATVSLTLPSASGTFLLTNGDGSSLTNLNASSLTSGTVGTARLGTGTADSTTYLRGDNTWQTISSGLTVGTTTTSGASAGDILTSDGSLMQKLTPGTGVSTWLATPTKANLNAAISDDDPAYVGTNNTFTDDQTITLTSLGTTGTTGLALINATAAANGAQQNSPRLQLTGEGYTTGGGSVTHNWYATVKPTQYTGTLPIGGGFPDLGYLQISADIDGSMNNVRSGYAGYNDLKLDLHGCLWLNAYGGRQLALGGTPAAGTAAMNLDTNSGIFMSQNHRFGWVTGFNAYAASDFELSRLATNTLALTDYTTGGTMLAVMLTHTSATSYEAGVIDTITTANTVRIGSAVGSGGGTARDVHLIHGGTVKASLTGSGFVIGSGGSAISKVLTATATLNFDLTALVVEDLTVTCTGAAVGDSVFIGVPNGSVTTSAQFTAWVSAADTVTVRCRTSVVGEDPASGTFRVDVHQH